MFLLRFAVSLALTAILLIKPLPAQDPPTREPQAVDLLGRAYAAIGGVTPFTVVATATYTRFTAEKSSSFPLRVKVLGLDRIRWELDGHDGVSILVFQNGVGWHEKAGETTRLSISQTSGRTLEYFPFLLVGRWLVSADASIRYQGLESVEGKSQHRLSLSRTLHPLASPEVNQAFESANRCEVFLDRDSFTPVRLRFYEHPDDWRIERAAELVFSNFRMVNGIRVPFTITRFDGDSKSSEVQFQSVMFNIPVADSDFMER